MQKNSLKQKILSPALLATAMMIFMAIPIAEARDRISVSIHAPTIHLASGKGRLHLGFNHHYGHGFGHRGYRGYGHYRHGYYSQFDHYDYRYRRPYRDYYDYPERRYSADDTTGWNHLERGDYKAALDVFARQAGNYPDTAAPQAGYAIAAASMGDYTRAAWAMRRALRADTDALFYAPRGPETEAQMDRLIADLRLRDRGAEYSQQNLADHAILHAALLYMRGEIPAARQAAETARRHGENSEALSKLQLALKS